MRQGLIPRGYSRFAIADGWYWWLSDHHSGQWSANYARLSKLTRLYTPSRMAHGPADETSQDIYDTLCTQHSCDHTEQTIARLTWATDEQRQKALGIINGDGSHMTYASVQLWIAKCYTMPSHIELQMCALNELLETHGDEALWDQDGSVTQPIAVYLNTGDSYAATIVYRYDLEKFQITSWGDLVEMWERQGKTIR